jgi:hypothetical protein
VKGLKSYMPRPTKCTPELTERICEYLASGCYVCTACDLCGIDQSTYHRWRERGENGEEPYCEFVKAIKDAEARAEAHAVALVQKAMVDDWKAAMTWMERKFPDRWSRGERREVTGAGGGPVAHSIIFEVVGGEEAAGEPDSDGD